MIKKNTHLKTKESQREKQMLLFFNSSLHEAAPFRPPPRLDAPTGVLHIAAQERSLSLFLR